MQAFSVVSVPGAAWWLAAGCFLIVLALLRFVPARARKFVGAAAAAVFVVLPLSIPYYCCWCADSWWCPCYLLGC